MGKFIETRAGDENSTKNDGLEHCRKRNIPDVVVDFGRNAACVEWDYISYPMGTEALLEAKENFLKTELGRIYDKYCTEKSEFSFSVSVAKILNLSIQNAKVAAEEIYDLIDGVVNSKKC